MAARLHGIAVLESARSAAGREKTVFFNAQMFGGHGADPIVALLKYFNGNNRVFGADPEPVLLHLRPALMDENVELDEGALPRSDYTLIGEVERLYNVRADEELTSQLRLDVSGTVIAVDKELRIFDIDIEQWVGFANMQGGKFPVRGVMRDSVYAKARPMPNAGSIVYATGTLLEAPAPTNGERFSFEVTSLMFLGRATVPPRSIQTPGKPAPKGLKFNFNESPLAGKSAQAAKKRRLTITGPSDPLASVSTSTQAQGSSVSTCAA